MVAKFTEELTALKAAWNTATYSRNTADEYKGVTLSITAEIMIDIDSYAKFSLRAPMAAHFGINSIDIPAAATLWIPSGKGGTTPDPNNELLAINTDFAWESIHKRRSAGRSIKFKLPSPITKSKTDRTIHDDAGSSPRADGKAIKIQWIKQSFPQIASKDYIAAFVVENCSIRPLEVRVGSKRAFIKQSDTTLPKPSELKPAAKQIEGRRGRKSGT